METRIIKTKYWSDPAIMPLSSNAKYLFMYLLTCPQINMVGVFELSDEIIKFQTGLTSEELGTAKLELAGAGRADFFRSWVIIPNAVKNNRYVSTPMNYPPIKNQINNIPEEVKKFIESNYTTLHTTLYTTLYSTIHSTLNTKYKKEGGLGGDRRPRSSTYSNYQQNQPLQANRMYYEVTDYKQATSEQRDRILNCCEYGAPANRPDWTPPANTPQKYLDLFKQWKATHEDNN